MAAATTETIRLTNSLSLLRTLRACGPVARVDLAPMTGLSPATVTAITTELRSRGLIRELEPEIAAGRGRGRPKTLVDLDAQASFAVCIRLSTNEIHLTVGDFKGAIRKRVIYTLDTRVLEPEALCALIIDKVEALRAAVQAAYRHFAGVFMAVQGIVAPLAGSIVWSPALSARNVPLAERLRAALHCPVILDNDANAVGQAVAAQPQFAAYRHVAVVMLGNGVGMCLLVDGKPYLGASGASAEFGHTKVGIDGPLCACGKHGCIEAYISDYALYREAVATLELPPSERFHPTEQQMRLLTARACGGDTDARAVFERAGRALGLGLANVLALLDPDIVVVTGAGVRGFELMASSMQATLEQALVDDLIGDTRIIAHPWDQDLSCIGGVATALEAADAQLL